MISAGFDYDGTSKTLERQIAAKPYRMPAESQSTLQSLPLDQLQAILEREIPMCANMGIAVHEGSSDGLVMRMPLAPNRNHQRTAFAGSLNALCTIAGWGSVYLLLQELRREGNIVIRRGTIKYQEPVTAADIFARCLPVTKEARQYFVEMLYDKGQTKLDLTVEIAGSDGPAVSFHGSYVVLPPGAPVAGVPF